MMIRTWPFSDNVSTLIEHGHNVISTETSWCLSMAIVSHVRILCVCMRECMHIYIYRNKHTNVPAKHRF